MYLAIISGAIQMLNLLTVNIPKWIAAARQTGEFTPEEEAAWQAQYKTALGLPHWQPDPPNTNPPTTRH